MGMYMTSYDFIIVNKEFKTYYYYLDDFEFGGWQTSNNPKDADGFDTIEESENEIFFGELPPSEQLMICKRQFTVEGVSWSI